jgi:rod shape-determining protein MreB and related proteins
VFGLLVQSINCPAILEMHIFMTEKESSTVHFIVEINFRDTRIKAAENNQTIWEKSIAIGGVDWVIALMDYLKESRDLLVGRRTAEVIILELGMPILSEQQDTRIVRGRDRLDGKPGEREITNKDVHQILHHSIRSLIDQISFCLLGSPTLENGIPISPSQIPAELRAFLAAKPILLAGEFARLNGLDQLLAEKLQLPVVHLHSV